MAQAHLNITPLSTPPTDNLGTDDIYLDDGTNTASGNPGFRRYDGTAWEDIGATAGIKELYLPAREGLPTVTAGCAALAQSETTTNKVNYQSLDFDQTTQEHAQFHFMMPDNWNAGTITFKALWTAASGTGTVTFGLQGVSFANDDALDAAFGTAQTVTDTLLATGDVHVSPTSAAMTIAGTPAAGELVVLRVYRDISGTLDADAKLIGLKIYYTATT